MFSSRVFLCPPGCLPLTKTHGILSHSGGVNLYLSFPYLYYYPDQVYLPCALIVVLSWVGFWLNREATSDRVTLGSPPYKNFNIKRRLIAIQE